MDIEQKILSVLLINLNIASSDLKKKQKNFFQNPENMLVKPKIGQMLVDTKMKNKTN